MNRLMKGLLVIAFSVGILGGCAVDPSVKPWWSLREANFLALRSGKTTKAEARTALGNPFNTTTFQNQGEEVWDYRFPDGGRIMLAWVYFDMSGTYKYYTAQPDPAFYSSVGP